MEFIPFKLDLEAVDTAAGTNFFGGDGEAITDIFLQMSYDAITTSTIDNLGAVGSVVVDSGLSYYTALTPAFGGSIPPDNEGFGSDWGLTMVWNDLTGEITYNDGTTINATYSSGTFDFYVDYDPYALTLGDESTYIDGEKVMTLSVTNGSYALDLSGTGGSSYTIWAEFASIIPDFMLVEDSGGTWVDIQDTSYYGTELLLAYSHGDNDPESVEITEVGNDLIVVSDHNSSTSFAVVPEPTTMILFGIGLLGFAGISRKKISG